jgi:hypothetical protein
MNLLMNRVDVMNPTVKNLDENDRRVSEAEESLAKTGKITKSRPLLQVFPFHPPEHIPPFVDESSPIKSLDLAKKFKPFVE